MGGSLTISIKKLSYFKLWTLVRHKLADEVVTDLKRHKACLHLNSIIKSPTQLLNIDDILTKPKC